MKKLMTWLLALLLIAALTGGASAEGIVSEGMEPAVPETEAALPENDAAAGHMAVSEVEYLDDDKALYIYDEGLTSLDDYNLTPDLLQLGVSDNKLTRLDASRVPLLESLWCENNRLTSLNVSKNTALTQLNCDTNQLAGLDLSRNTELLYLWCGHNQLTGLDLSKNTRLRELYCSGNRIAVLDLSNCKGLLAAVQKGKKKEKNGALLFEYYEEDDEGDERLYTVEIDPSTAIVANGKTVYGEAVADRTDIAGAKVTVKAQVYTGSALTPKATVKLGNKTLTAGTDYTVAYKNNTKIGKATVTVAGTGNYTGTVKAAFAINPKKVSGLKLQPGTRKLTVSWKKVKGVTGYEIEYGLKQDFKGAKKVKVQKAETVQKALTRLGAGKKYYVRVRAYKKVGKKTYCSAWTKGSQETK